MAWDVRAKLSIRKGRPEWFEGSAQLAEVNKAIAKAARSLLQETLKNACFTLRWSGQQWQVTLNDENYTDITVAAPLSAILLTALDPEVEPWFYSAEARSALQQTLANVQAKLDRIKVVESDEP